MRDDLWASFPLLVVVGLLVLVVGGFFWYSHDLATRCIASGMQWISGSCVR